MERVVRRSPLQRRPGDRRARHQQRRPRSPCQHEHACIRCPVLQMDPRQRPRLLEIIKNLRERITEARGNGWLGEVEGLQVLRRRDGQAQQPQAGLDRWPATVSRPRHAGLHRRHTAALPRRARRQGWQGQRGRRRWAIAGVSRKGAMRGKGGAQPWSAAPAERRAELTDHSDPTSPHGVLGFLAHSACSIRALAAFSCSSMCSLVSPRASDMETAALRRPSSVTPLRVM